MFFVAKYGPEEAGSILLLLLAGAFVAIIRAFIIDPDEGLASFRESFS